MACAAFKAALMAPETDASNAQIRALITAGKYDGKDLPHVAEDYLTAFIDSDSSHIRRRWAGIALSKMLAASPKVVDHLKVENSKLQDLGDILVSKSEREDTKIVAGIIMRQGLSQGLEFANFWSTDKVRNSVNNFPGEAGPRWMTRFQGFLDTLSHLALANPVTDPCILYPVAVVTSDEFRWASATGGVPIAIGEWLRSMDCMWDTH